MFVELQKRGENYQLQRIICIIMYLLIAADIVYSFLFKRLIFDEVVIKRLFSILFSWKFLLDIEVVD